MNSPKKIKKLVKEKYAQIAQTGRQGSSCCSGSECCSGSTTFSDDYSKLDGYTSDADLGLGCGIPTEHAGIRAGHTVLDLGSGAGNDVFVARRLVGEAGKVIGVDMTEAMVEKARLNNEHMGYTNVEFRLGDIESLPVSDTSVDVVISNCVLNLVPDKRAAYREILRVLKPGGRFSISDIVIRGNLPDSIKAAAELYAGCVAGALGKDEYLGTIAEVGFRDVTVVKEKQIVLPDELLLKHISREDIEEFKFAGTAILSITVVANKPATGTD